METLVSALRIARTIGESPAFKPWREAEIIPGPDAQDEQAWRAHIRQTTWGPEWHPSGTCRRGTDEMAVVDPELRVRGVQGLRVADASVIPVEPSTKSMRAS